MEIGSASLQAAGVDHTQQREKSYTRHHSSTKGISLFQKKNSLSSRVCAGG